MYIENFIKMRSLLTYDIYIYLIRIHKILYYTPMLSQKEIFQIKYLSIEFPKKCSYR